MVRPERAAGEGKRASVFFFATLTCSEKTWNAGRWNQLESGAREDRRRLEKWQGRRRRMENFLRGRSE